MRAALSPIVALSCAVGFVASCGDVAPGTLPPPSATPRNASFMQATSSAAPASSAPAASSAQASASAESSANEATGPAVCAFAKDDVARAALCKVAQDPRSLSAIVDPKRGLAVVHFEEYSSDKGGVTSEVLCAGEIAEISEDVAKEIATPAVEGGIECDADPARPICSQSGWEFGPDITYYFERRGEHDAVLRAIVYVSVVNTDDFHRKGSAFVTRALDQAEHHRCR